MITRKKICLLSLLLLTTTIVAQEKYTADWESLKKHEVPQWAKDAKFGIYAHWGVYSVSGAWDHTEPNWANGYICGYIPYYRKSGELGKLFEKNVGKIEDGIGYKDLAKQFNPVKFDPKYWAELIKKSGAQYAGICAVHHDGYCMWDSEITDFCAGKLGPERDLYGELINEIRKQGLKTFASFHHERTHKHFAQLAEKLKANPKMQKADLLDPKYKDLYWFLCDEDEANRRRHALTIEVINKYKPDVLWFDGGGQNSTEVILAEFFNMGIRENKEVCVHNKGNFGNNFGVYSYENGIVRPDYIDWPWEDDTPSGIHWDDWPWYKGMEYKKPRDIIVRLCDLVARNGGLLLSLNPTGDGSLEKEQVDLLLGIGKWLEQNGEAIYNTVPWKIYAEGHVKGLEFREKHPTTGKETTALRPDPRKLNWEDVRFTRNNNTLYATVLGVPPSGKVNIKSLANNVAISDKNQIASVELLGHGKVKWERTDEALIIDLPKQLPNEWALAFKIVPTGELDKSKPAGMSSSRKQRNTVR